MTLRVSFYGNFGHSGIWYYLIIGAWNLVLDVPPPGPIMVPRTF